MYQKNIYNQYLVSLFKIYIRVPFLIRCIFKSIINYYFYLADYLARFNSKYLKYLCQLYKLE